MAKKRRKDPATSADKLVAGLQGATKEMEDGVDSVTESPTVSALKQKDKMRQRFLDALNSPQFDATMKGVTVERWRKRYKENINRIADGASKSKAKSVAYYEEQNRQRDAIQTQLDRIGKGTDAQALDKIKLNMEAVRKASAAYKAKKQSIA